MIFWYAKMERKWAHCLSRFMAGGLIAIVAIRKEVIDKYTGLFRPDILAAVIISIGIITAIVL